MKAFLGTLGGHGEISAEVDYDYYYRSGGKGDGGEEACQFAVRVDDTESGLHVHWPRSILEAAAAEEAARAADPDLRTPTRRAMSALSSGSLMGYLNGSADLLRNLDVAELTGEKAVDWKGRPARRLSFKLNPKVGAKDKKYLKALDATLVVWVGEGGEPLAAERRYRMKARAFMVISFEAMEFEEFEFTALDGRLVVTRHLRESAGSGAGESNTIRSVATLKLVPGA